MTRPRTAVDRQTIAADGTQLSLTTRDMRTVLASSFAGSVVEYYDFILYATASAIVFDKVFFTDLGPGFATFASFATFAVGYLARPLGGIVFGHLGDTQGRKRVLITTMAMMGVASLLIGLLPTTGQVGILAPISLVVLRIVQGISVGGEWGGATLMALEHAPAHSRGLAAGWANAGGPVGAVLATLMLALFSLLPDEDFLSWGWRVPFLFNVVMLVIGLVIRARVAESPMYQQLEHLGRDRERGASPLTEVVRTHWDAMLVAFAAVLAFTTSQGLMTVWGVSRAVDAGASDTGVLVWKAVGAITTAVVSLLAARLSDRIGRRTVILIGAGAGIVLAFPIVMLLESGTVAGFDAAILIGNGLVQGVIYGPVAAYVSELFPTRLRFSGASAPYQVASAVGAGLSPLVASSLVLAFGGIWPVAVFWMLVLAGTGAVILARPDTREVDLQRA